MSDRKPLAKLPSRLTSTTHPARLWDEQPNGRVVCHLSPRECNIPAGGVGFCGVRHNVDGRLVTLNYGKSVAVTRETIETEAVYHYAPGESILSLGNIGCMMACDFCHNWQTSQARHARDQDIHLYTPEEIVAYAMRHGIRVLSWTYNDPVVWHEFVVDTARLAKDHGIKNLYKSAFYIGPRAVEELIEVIDIFSVSLKSLDPVFYRKYTKGHLEPVLDAIRQVHRSRGPDGPHLEISNLCVTGRNDNLEAGMAVAEFVLRELDAEVPLHYVRFHPDYKYTHVPRTSIEFLEDARRAALAAGLRHVYVGNVYDTPSNNTLCSECGALLVERRGPQSVSHFIGETCSECGARVPIVLPFGVAPSAPASANLPAASELERFERITHHFRSGVQALHVEQESEDPIIYQFITADGVDLGIPLSSACKRFLITNSDARAHGVRIMYEPSRIPRIFEVFDRAHFPTVDVATAVSPSDDRPLPLCST